MSEARRGIAARIGLTLLNLLAPGLGLLRIGRLRDALIVYGVAVAALLILILGFSSTDAMGFTAYAILVGFVLAASLVAYLLAFWWTWRSSAQITRPLPTWSLWYSILAVVVLSFGLSSAITYLSKSLYRNFYIPSEAMEPTLIKNDKLVASMRAPKDLHRGDILLVRAPGGATYVKRLAGLPGDRIALRGGVVFINGVAAATKAHGSRAISYPYIETKRAQLYLEQFPGEARPHLVQDLGPSPEDDFPEIAVAPGHVFMLGDNRDDSADSRIPKEMGGMELVPVSNILGRPLFFYRPWKKIGQAVQSLAP